MSDKMSDYYEISDAIVLEYMKHCKTLPLREFHYNFQGTMTFAQRVWWILHCKLQGREIRVSTDLEAQEHTLHIGVPCGY
jgi:hypothetical protein